ncbi:Protein-disulfide isomerase [Salinihabitans flavidus]|uniref:Protein-disulfide isomerase n=1 Tax=Salinihabitans flavidus TaxID=569882 RepID=A0A1H8T5M1_9RHOB|nr:DsbA family protein [Salinihabitans flavidus]SEO85808.1 Protein-disulfide isomerase [Salinihabitans flavidus]
MNRIVPIALAALIAIGGGVYWYTQQSATPAATELQTQAQSSPDEEAQPAEDVDVSSVTEMTLGEPDAPVKIIEYASFTCPHCATFHENAFKRLRADYIETGKVHFIYREVYFDRFGLWASLVARCGGQERFFGIADLLYKGQSDWTSGNDPVAIADAIRKVGRLAGVGDETLQACLQDEERAQTLVAWYQQNANKHDINSTPSFVIDGQKYSNMSYDEMKEIIDGKL